MEEIVNKVASSGLITFDLEDYYTKGVRIGVDISQFYDENGMLREKAFRDELKNHDWSRYKNNLIFLYDSSDAIVPAWTTLLVTTYLSDYANYVCLGNLKDLERELFLNELHRIDFSIYKDKKVIIKGCSKNVPESAYIFLIQKLKPLVSSLMYGEACSSVPLFKKKV
ncbi:MAG: DUF2480 family protein [Flavobacteriales bacterium]|nr:DUF2480 family protein [Flavobacteriales bacterium]